MNERFSASGLALTVKNALKAVQKIRQCVFFVLRHDLFQAAPESGVVFWSFTFVRKSMRIPQKGMPATR